MSRKQDKPVDTREVKQVEKSVSQSVEKTSEKPKFLQEEEQEQEQEQEEMTSSGLPTLGEEPVSAFASTDEIAEPEVRENVRDYMGKLLLISSFYIRPVVREDKFMYISHIDGCVIQSDDTIQKIKDAGVIDKDVKEMIKKECQPVKLYSTSSGIANSLNGYVKDNLSRGRVLVEVSSKKGRYPQDIILLKNPFY
jgi:hypothetical protein